MSMQHNFDEIIDRTGTNSSKWLKYPADVLPMWVADSDFKCPKPVVDAIVKLAEHGVYGYPYVGEGSFEKATVGWAKRRYGVDADVSMVDFAPSLGTALAVAVMAFTDKGDNVLMQSPIYPPFPAVAKYNGRHPSYNSIQLKDGKYQIDFEDFEKRAADPKTKLFLLCSPHNPLGRVFTREELTRMVDICRKHNVVIFSDEIHADYIFSGHKHISLPTLSPEAAEICLLGLNPSKTFNIAGMRTASVVTLTKALQEQYQAALAGCKLGRSPFGVLAYTVAYTDCDYYADQVRAYIEGNMDFAVKFINERIGKIHAYKPEATYLLWLDCKGLGFASQKDLEAFFLEKAKVGMNGGTSFGVEGEGFMRMNLAAPRSVVAEGLTRIEKAVAVL